jgi:tellurite resistance protein TerC
MIDRPGIRKFRSKPMKPMKPIRQSYKLAKRIAITVIGVSILAVGIVMIVTPGPALVLIPVGLAILGLEFAWARLWLKRLRENLSARNMRAHGERAETHRRRHTQ